jgi:hypothetical protein
MSVVTIREQGADEAILGCQVLKTECMVSPLGAGRIGQ